MAKAALTLDLRSRRRRSRAGRSQLARALQVSADELLGLAPPKKSRAAQEDAEAQRLRKKVLQVMTLPERDRRAVIRLINSLAETKGREATGGAR